VIEAVESGRFTVYGVSTIDEAVEMLTGLVPGERSLEGTYPERTVYGNVSRRLSELARKAHLLTERSRETYQGGGVNWHGL
jgi:hypothetical protein